LSCPRARFRLVRVKITVPVPQTPVSPNAPGKRPSIHIPQLCNDVVQLTPEECEQFKEKIEALTPPVFIELKAPDGTLTVWVMEEDFKWLAKAKAAA